MSKTLLRPAVFLDRDGVINEELGYVHRVEDFHILPGVLEGLAVLQRAGYALVVITNQAGIARGIYSESTYLVFTQHIIDHFRSMGIVFLGFYHCPHHPSGLDDLYRINCNCRKPMPGLLLQAAAEHGLDLDQSVLIGDKRSDIDAGRAAGVASCVLVESGHRLDPDSFKSADIVLPGLLEAAQWIVSGHSRFDRLT